MAALIDIKKMQTMGGMLQIPPFPLQRLEAALFPGPHPPPKQPWPEPPQEAEGQSGQDEAGAADDRVEGTQRCERAE